MKIAAMTASENPPSIRALAKAKSVDPLAVLPAIPKAVSKATAPEHSTTHLLVLVNGFVLSSIKHAPIHAAKAMKTRIPFPVNPFMLLRALTPMNDAEEVYHGM